MTAREKGKTHLDDELLLEELDDELLLLLEDEDELDEDELHVVTAIHLNVRMHLLNVLHQWSDHLPLSPAK
jgi:hypothetical protein